MTINRIMLVARRDFLATVSNKGFVIGLLIMPALIGVMILAGPRIINSRSPQVRGEVAIVDATGHVAGEMQSTLAPAAIGARRRQNARRALSNVAPAVAEAAESETATARAVGQVPMLQLVARPADADVQHEKRWLLESSAEQRHLALIVVHPNAVTRSGTGGTYGGYDLYVSGAVDEATESAIHESMQEALIAARFRSGNLDRALVDEALRVPRPRTLIVRADGEQAADRGFTRFMPFVLALFIFVGVMVGGQTLMTSTVEEKSSRVVEVLLAAVSPFELMAGKLLGQLGASLLVIGLYLGLGVFALYSFAMFGLLNPMIVVYLLVFFLITYLVFGALMLAIGAAVNQMAEAQSLMGPVMLLLMAPYMLSFMIGRAPNSTFSVAVSFIPPINTITMMSRLASDAPPPAWQPWLSVLIGIATACAIVWFAAKVFRIGLLMHGKPPNFATLIRWARAA